MKTIFLFIAFIGITFSTSAQNQTRNELLVEGKASLKIIPEQMVFRIQITVSDTNYAHCSDLALKKAQEIKDKFTANGIDEKLIKFSNYSIREIREHDHLTRKSVFKEYRADIPVIIETQTDYKKNDVIFNIIKTNFNANLNLYFELTSEQKDEAKTRLISMAVEDAKQKAAIITGNAGVKTYAISNIQYGEPQLIRGYANPNYDLRKEQLMIRGNATPSSTLSLNPAEIEMQTSIIIAWRL